MTLPSTPLRIGTLNVRTLAGRLGAVLDLAHRHSLHICCLQETRLPADSAEAVILAARAAGWQTLYGKQGVDARGNIIGGTLIFSSWPAEPFPLPPDLAAPERVTALRVARPGQRPLLVVNVYLHANDRYAAGHTLDHLFAWVALLGEEAIVIGDFNLQITHWPLSAALATGQWYACDDSIQGENNQHGTHRDANGVLTGTCIDFALATPQIFPLQRQQFHGVADHDLVYYDFHVAGRFEPVWRLPAAAPLTTAEVTASQWDMHWHPYQDPFHDAVQKGNVQQAWELLSNGAEQALQPQGRISRANRRGPRLHANGPSTKAPTFQTLPERQLRRVARRLAEYQRTAEPNLERKLHRDIARLDFTLLDRSLLDPGLLQTLWDQADALAATAAARRLAHWKDAVQEDVHKLSKWVQRQPASNIGTDSFAAPILPAQRAHCEASTWQQVWNPDTLPCCEEIKRFCHRLGDQTPPTTLAPITGTALRAVAKQGRNKAPGLDAWTCNHLCCLPEPFWNILATFWEACLREASVPATWKCIRIALIPKSSGGLRPLAIATVFWRICMTATMRALRPWLETWIPPQIFGGVPAKGILDLHEQLHDDLEDTAVVGCKADVRRCFDSVTPDAALQVWRWLGAPIEVVGVLTQFYTQQQRWFSWHGTFHPTPVTIQRGILQGCPASVALLNSLMAVWVRHVHAQAPQACLAVYLDDRTVWGRGDQGLNALILAMHAGDHVDRIFGLQLHPDKLQSFANMPDLLVRLEAHAALVGQATASFHLLGFHYKMLEAGCVDATRLTATVQERCRKIRVAARGHRLRCALLRMLVLPLFAWCGAWQHFPKAIVHTWTMAVETTIWGRKPPPGRSRFLFWHTLGNAELHPRFALLFAAIRSEWKRQCRQQLGLPSGRHPCPQWKFVTRHLQWRVQPAGLWEVPHTCRPGWASLTVLRTMAREAFLRYLWQDDTKTQTPLSSALVPYLGFHKAIVDEVTYYGARVLCGAAVDGRVLARLGGTAECECHELVATREHLTFFCNRHPWRSDLRSATERRLLVPLVKAPTLRHYEPMVADPTLVQFLRDFPAAKTPILAVDGSGAYGHASWAVVAHEGPTVAGHVTGLDQTPHAGERSALLQLCLASFQAGRAVRFLQDNTAVLDRLTRGLQHGNWSGDLQPFWTCIADHWLVGNTYTWVPSHGTRPDWRPPKDWPSPDLCRALNHTADRAAGALTLCHRADHMDMCGEHLQAHRWASTAFAAQLEATMPYFDSFCELQRSDCAEWA